MADGFGKYDVYAISGSIYCYLESNVLRNHFGIRDAEKLRRLETDISVIRQKELYVQPINGRFTVNHLCAIHRYLLSDVYPFAGRFRREDIAKGNTRFLAHGEIKGRLTILLQRLASEHYLEHLDNAQFLERSAYYFAELNYIHPFREGNGRAIREFMRQLFDRNGFLVNWSNVSVTTLMEAMVESIYTTDKLIVVLGKCLQTKPIKNNEQ